MSVAGEQPASDSSATTAQSARFQTCFTSCRRWRCSRKIQTRCRRLGTASVGGHGGDDAAG
jgi:hypothetical protein